ncbi:DUF4097 family beta strand repeat protein [bacterium]|nr:DUF4097 family beta strand repeat protein [bacterium]
MSSACCKTAVCIVLSISCGVTWGQSSPPAKKTISIHLSQPGQSGRLRIHHYKGSITVNGYDGSLVMVTAAYRERGAGEGERKPGPELSAVERNNEVTVYSDSERYTVDLDILVPRNMDLHLQTYDNGVIEVANVQGELEINNTNGPVTLINVSGAAVVSTVDGNILVKFAGVTAGAPMAFTSITGDIDLTFPEHVDMLLKMNTDYGDIFHDTRLTVAPDKSGTSMKIGVLNRGGTETLIKTLNGNIYIR